MYYTGIEKAWSQSKQANERGGAVGWSQPARSIGSGITQREEGDLGNKIELIDGSKMKVRKNEEMKVGRRANR